MLFALVILISQVLQFINTQIIDNKHNKYLIEKHEVTNASEEALIQSSRIQRALLNQAIATDSLEKKEIQARILSCEQKNEGALAAMAKGRFIIEDFDLLFLKIWNAEQVYKSAYGFYLSFLVAGDRNKALAYKNATLRPALESYQELLQKLLTRISTSALEESQEITTYTNVSGWILFLLGISPYIYILSSLSLKLIKAKQSTKRKGG